MTTKETQIARAVTPIPSNQPSQCNDPCAECQCNAPCAECLTRALRDQLDKARTQIAFLESGLKWYRDNWSKRDARVLVDGKVG